MAKRTVQNERGLARALKELGADDVEPLPVVRIPKMKRRRQHERRTAAAPRPRSMWPLVLLGVALLGIVCVGIGYYPLQTIALCAVIAVFGGVVIYRR